MWLFSWAFDDDKTNRSAYKIDGHRKTRCYERSGILAWSRDKQFVYLENVYVEWSQYLQNIRLTWFLACIMRKCSKVIKISSIPFYIHQWDLKKLKWIKMSPWTHMKNNTNYGIFGSYSDAILACDIITDILRWYSTMGMYWLLMNVFISNTGVLAVFYHRIDWINLNTNANFYHSSNNSPNPFSTRNHQEFLNTHINISTYPMCSFNTEKVQARSFTV